MSCNNSSTCAYQIEGWKFNHSKSRNRQGYLKPNDTINLSINVNRKSHYRKGKKRKNNENFREFLRGHDFQFEFTIGDDILQEVVCHNERLGINDVVSCFILLYLIILSYKY